MTPTAISLILSHIVARLTDAPAVCPLVQRVRLRAFGKSVQHAVVVAPDRSTLDAAANPYGAGVRETVVRVECYARDGDASTPDGALDALVAAVYERLRAPDWQPPFELVDAGITYEFSVAEEAVGCAVLSLVAHTVASDHTLAALGT